jgi:glycerophosphoryl diester phosphodiesterase
MIFESTALASSELPHQPLIAHAGGHIYGYKYTNSLEALENSYNNGFRFIELDFDWTQDNQIVLIHDWNGIKIIYDRAQSIY